MKTQEGNDSCLCCSGKLAEQCCMPLLNGVANAKTPIALMRSRFTAYALGGYGAYLLKTWLPIQRAGLNERDLSIRSCNWSRLEVGARSQQGHKGFVEFKAYYLDDDFSELCHHEKSVFQRVQGKWYYVGC